MSDILDAIDALANASVEAMNKMPEVSDDVSWARKILESIDGVYVKVNTSLSHIIKKLEIMSYGSSIISSDVVSYEAEKRLRDTVDMMSNWKQRVEDTVLELDVAAVRMIIVCEISRLYRSDQDIHDLINHGLVKIARSKNGEGDDVLLVFDSGETAEVVTSFKPHVLGRRAMIGLEDADLEDGLFSTLDVNGAKQKALSLAGELSALVNEAGRIKDALDSILPAIK